MKRLRTVFKPGPGRRLVVIMWLAIAGVGAVDAASAVADAGNPILGTISGAIVPDSSGSGVTVYVQGQWNWLTHNSDCNFDRAATGVGIIWNDPNGASRSRTISTAMVDGSGNVTLTTTTNETFSVGDQITVSGVSGGTGYNGSFIITGVGGNQVKYATNPKATGSGTGGTVTDLNVFNGYQVSKSPITAYVGTSTATPGNPVDEMVHPVDLGNVPQGFTAGTWESTSFGYSSNVLGDYPFGQKFNDPNPPGITSTQVSAWKGGCGREPLTATGPAGSGGSGHAGFVNSACAGGGSCSGHPWGSWGYDVNNGQGYSHHYASRSDVTTVCANFYDVHGGGNFGNKSFQVPQGASEITVNANGDNSIQTNAFNTAQGANCISFPLGNPSISTSATSGVTIGGSSTDNGSISDTATISGGSNPTGTVTFTVYAPNSNGTADTTCSTPVGTLGPVTVNGDGSYPSGSFTPSGTAPQIAGTYEWKATYSGDGNNAGITSACNATGEQSVVNRHGSKVPTGQKIAISDMATVGSASATPTGTIDFQLFEEPSSGCTTNKIYDSGSIPLVNGQASTSSATTQPPTLNAGANASATFSWLVTYTPTAGSNFIASSSACGVEQTTISGNTPGVDP